MLKKANAHYHSVVTCDTSRFMTLDNVCRKASWAESLGALTLGASVVSTIHHPRCNGLRGDLEALGGDFHRVGKKLTPEIRKLAVTPR